MLGIAIDCRLTVMRHDLSFIVCTSELSLVPELVAVVRVPLNRLGQTMSCWDLALSRPEAYTWSESLALLAIRRSCSCDEDVGYPLWSFWVVVFLYVEGSSHRTV